MKALITIVALGLIVVQPTTSQELIVYKNNQSVVSIPLSEIDSITFSSYSLFTSVGRENRGIAYDSGILWTVSGRLGVGDSVRITKIDAETGQILNESPEIPWNGRGITIGAGALWLTDALYDVVRKIDPNDLTEMKSFSTPGTEPTGIAYDGINLWIVDPYFQNIYQVDTSGNVLDSYNIPNEYRNGLEWEGNGMWTKTDTTEISFYTTDGSITSVKTFTNLPIHPGFYDIAIGGGKVYISSLENIYIQDWGVLQLGAGILSGQKR